MAGPAVPYPGFIGGSYTSLSPIALNERTVNFYLQQVPGPKHQHALYPWPGVSELGVHATDAVGRAIFEENGRAFAVIGETFVEIDAAGVMTDRGTVLEDGSAACITSNGDGGLELFVSSGDKGYLFDLNTNTFTEMLASGCAFVDSLDGFFLALDTAQSLLRASSLFDGSSWPGAAFDQRTGAPDPWRALIVQGTLIYLPGERTCDIYYNAGTSPFPFAKHTGGTIPFGIVAPHSLARIGNEGVAWLARTADGFDQVVLAVGLSAKIISDESMSVRIRGYREDVGVEDAVGESLSFDGHVFYLLTFPAADATWVYDLTTGKWLEIGEWQSADARYAAWRPHWHCLAFGQHLMLDRQTGQVHRIRFDLQTDAAGADLRRLRRAPSLWMQGEKVTYSSLELYLEAGLGLESGQGSNPLVVLNYSNDGGKTWAEAASTPTAGAQGNYRTRVEWNRLGTARDRAFEVVFSDPIPWRLFGAGLRVRPR